MNWVVALLPLALLMLLIVIDVGYARSGWKIARSMDLPRGQTLRYVKTLAFGPIMALLAVGVLLGSDVIRSWQHLLVCAGGAVGGVWVGRWRCQQHYVRADPQHHAVVVVRSLLDYRLLSILIFARIAATRDGLPEHGWLSLLVSFLLSAVVFEACGQAWLLYRRYESDVAGMPEPDGRQARGA